MCPWCNFRSSAACGLVVRFPRQHTERLASEDVPHLIPLGPDACVGNGNASMDDVDRAGDAAEPSFVTDNVASPPTLVGPLE